MMDGHFKRKVWTIICPQCRNRQMATVKPKTGPGGLIWDMEFQSEAEECDFCADMRTLFCEMIGRAVANLYPPSLRPEIVIDPPAP